MGLVVGGGRARRGAAARRPGGPAARSPARWCPASAAWCCCVAGGYVAWYGWYELRLAAGRRDALDDPVIQAASQLQQTLANTLDTIGPALLLAALAALLLLTAALAKRRPHRPTLEFLSRQKPQSPALRRPKLQDRRGEGTGPS